MGDLSDFFIKNPSMISEVINNKEHIEMQLKYLKWYFYNEDFILSTYYGMDYGNIITETNPQELIVYSSNLLFIILFNLK